MPQYQVSLLNDDYTYLVHLPNAGSTKTWSRLEYRQCVNDVESAQVQIVPSASQISSIAVMKRLQIVRDGVVVFSGPIVRLGWEISESAPEGDTFVVDALGGAVYAEWRLAVPATGSEFVSYTDHADDVAKDFVYNHLGAGAAAARQFSDLTIAADANAAASITEEARYETILSILQKLSDQNGFDWRFVPSTSGFTFTTALGQLGEDRTEGNGVNAEAILSLDRRNVKTMSYDLDTMPHRNYVYVAGEGEGVDRLIQERSTAGDITAYKRREMLYDYRASLAASLQNAGDAKLAELAVDGYLSAQPLSSTWPSLWDLGDLITVTANRYGRTFTENVEVTAINVTVEGDQETVEPELEEA